MATEEGEPTTTSMAAPEIQTTLAGNITFEHGEPTCPLASAPAALTARIAQYQNCRNCKPRGWIPSHAAHSLIVGTRFADTVQVHRVDAPGGARHQLTFFDEPILSSDVRPCTHAEGEDNNVCHRCGFVFLRDVGGGEAFQVFFFQAATGKSVLLSDGLSKHGSVCWSSDGAHLAFYTTRRNGRDWDVVSLDCSSSDVCAWVDTERTVCEGDGAYHPLDWSPDGRFLLLKKYCSINESYLFVLDVPAGSPPVPLLVKDAGEEVDADEKIAVGFAAFAPAVVAGALCGGTGQDTSDGSPPLAVLFTSDIRSEYRKLYIKALGDSSSRVPLSADIAWDIGSVELSHTSGNVVAVVKDDGSHRLMRLSLSERCLVELRSSMPSPVILTGLVFHPDGQQLAIGIDCATHPSDAYVLDLRNDEEGSTPVRWSYSEVGGLDTQQFVAPSLVRYPTFDVLGDGCPRMIPAFYYYPASASAEKPVPVMVYIHGGPESQFVPSFIPSFQFIVNELNIAIIAPNVRGSSGYGKSYLLLDNQRKREDSVKDIGLLIDWIMAQPELGGKQARVLVDGGSYGGYMVLASLVHFGDRLLGGMERVGISNFVTFLDNTKPYRKHLRRQEYGDESDPDMRAFLHEISPLTRASEIRKPLFIAQGLNDPRVPASESEQIKERVRENKVPVWYMVASDEGHGFKKKVNIDRYRIAQVMFLRKVLGLSDE